VYDSLHEMERSSGGAVRFEDASEEFRKHVDKLNVVETVASHQSLQAARLMIRKDLRPKLDEMVASGELEFPGGHLYETTIDVDPEDLLDWDAPLAEQSEKVMNLLEDAEHPVLQEALQRVIDAGRYGEPHRATGAGLHKEVVERLMRQTAVPGKIDGASRLVPSLTLHEAKLEAAKLLQEAGIPGVQYLDEFSRAGWRQAYPASPKPRLQVNGTTIVEDPATTRNIVMFEGSEELVRIDKIDDQSVGGALADKHIKEGALRQSKKEVIGGLGD
jgi:hypothetical protein